MANKWELYRSLRDQFLALAADDPSLIGMAQGRNDDPPRRGYIRSGNGITSSPVTFRQHVRTFAIIHGMKDDSVATFLEWVHAGWPDLGDLWRLCYHSPHVEVTDSKGETTIIVNYELPDAARAAGSAIERYIAEAQWEANQPSPTVVDGAPSANGANGWMRTQAELLTITRELRRWPDADPTRIADVARAALAIFAPHKIDHCIPAGAASAGAGERARDIAILLSAVTLDVGSERRAHDLADQAHDHAAWIEATIRPVYGENWRSTEATTTPTSPLTNIGKVGWSQRRLRKVAGAAMGVTELPASTFKGIRQAAVVPGAKIGRGGSRHLFSRDEVLRMADTAAAKGTADGDRIARAWRELCG